MFFKFLLFVFLFLVCHCATKFTFVWSRLRIVNVFVSFRLHSSAFSVVLIVPSSVLVLVLLKALHSIIDFIFPECAPKFWLIVLVIPTLSLIEKLSTSTWEWTLLEWVFVKVACVLKVRAGSSGLCWELLLESLLSELPLSFIQVSTKFNILLSLFESLVILSRLWESWFLLGIILTERGTWLTLRETLILLLVLIFSAHDSIFKILSLISDRFCKAGIFYVLVCVLNFFSDVWIFHILESVLSSACNFWILKIINLIFHRVYYLRIFNILICVLDWITDISVLKVLECIFNSLGHLGLLQIIDLVLYFVSNIGVLEVFELVLHCVRSDLHILQLTDSFLDCFFEALFFDVLEFLLYIVCDLIETSDRCLRHACVLMK